MASRSESARLHPRGRAKNGLENIVELGVLRNCSKCKTTKSVDEFSRNKRAPDGRRSWCKLCFKEYACSYNKTYYERNHDTGLERKRKYDDENREAINLRVKAIRKANPIPHRDQQHRRRAAKMGTCPETIVKEQWDRILLVYDSSCVYCGTKSNLTMDHVVPLSLGGTHTIDNIVPACQSCNASKGDRLLSELTDGGLLVVARLAAVAATQRHTKSLFKTTLSYPFSTMATH